MKSRFSVFWVVAIAASLVVPSCGSNKNPECRNAIRHFYEMGCEFEKKAEGLSIEDVSASEALNYCDTDFVICGCSEAYEAFVDCLQVMTGQQCTSCNSQLTVLSMCESDTGCAVDPRLLGGKVAD